MAYTRVRLFGAAILLMHAPPAVTQQPTLLQRDVGVACQDPAVCAQIAKLSESVKKLQAEMARLRQQLAQAQLDRQRALIKEWHSELQQVAEAGRQLEEQESARQQEVQETDDYLRRNDLPPDERVGAEAVRSELVGSGLQQLQAERAVLLERGAAARQRLELEQQRLREIEAAAREPAAERDVR